MLCLFCLFLSKAAVGCFLFMLLWFEPAILQAIIAATPLKITECRSLPFHLWHKTPTDTSKEAACWWNATIASWWMKWTIGRSGCGWSGSHVQGLFVAVAAQFAVVTHVKGHFSMHDRTSCGTPGQRKILLPHAAFALWLNKTPSGIIGPEPLPRVSHSDKMLLPKKNQGPFWPQLFPPRPGREQRADHWKVTLRDHNQWKELLTQCRQELSSPWASSIEQPQNSKGFKGAGSLHTGQFHPCSPVSTETLVTFPNPQHWGISCKSPAVATLAVVINNMAAGWKTSVDILSKTCFSLSLSSSPGAVLMLKGSVLRFSFLDLAGALIQSPYEVWRDPNAPEDPDRPRKRKLVHFSPSSSQDAGGDGHLAVVCSERQAKVFLMPSQSCLFVHNITESSFVLRADVVSVCNSVCLACFCANGHVMTLRYSAASCSVSYWEVFPAIPFLIIIIITSGSSRIFLY